MHTIIYPCNGEAGGTEQTKREKLGLISGIAGVGCNVLLCVFKYLVGALSGSVSMTADAANNLSDAGSGLVTIVGTLLSGKPVDREHPFGHGRLEYIAALVVSFLILHMGFDLGRDAIESILHPTPLEFRPIFVLVPAGSVLMKLFLALLNHRLFRKTGNIALKAVRQDSLMDCITTLAALAALLLSTHTGALWLDGAIGLGVSIAVIVSGVEVAKDTLGPLLGQPPEQGLVQEIEHILLEEAPIRSVHDLIVHDYGPGHRLASAHAVVPAEEDVMRLHEAIDHAEKRIEAELGISICVHMDPVRSGDTVEARYRALTERLLANLAPDCSFHDFRCTCGDNETVLELELVVPFSEKNDPAVLAEELARRLKAADGCITAHIVAEHTYI